MKTLILAEHDNQILRNVCLPVIAAAQLLELPIDILVAGSNCKTVAEATAKINHVDRVLLADHAVYEYQLAENMASLIAELVQDAAANNRPYTYILCPATTFGKNILPRVAALLEVSMLSDVTQIISADTFVRPLYAGNINATVQSSEAIKLLSIRTTAFNASDIQLNNSTSIEIISKIIPNEMSTFVEHQLTVSERPELTTAKIVIAGGRGLKSADNFQLLEKIADQLGAAIGASRAAVDAGFAPNDYQVGQTGKVVAPELYIAVGISGAIQHLAGMKDSKVIVAINNDPDAPICQIADYWLVGDLFKILPELQTELDKVLSHV